MNSFFIFLTFIFFLTFDTTIAANIDQKFKNFKLTQKFKDKYKAELEQKSSSQEETRKEIVPDDHAPVYDLIMEVLGNTYKQIGQQQSANVIKFNKEFDMGKQNFSGFTWQKPMGFIFLGVDRQVVPDILHEGKWIVRDKFTFTVNVSTFLSNMKEEGMIEITSAQLSLFAGVQFSRVYTYTHFEGSYVDGLVSDYSKLFLSFLMFYKPFLIKMAPDEVLAKEDYLTFNAGGIIKSPASHGFSASAGALVQANLISKVVVHRPNVKAQDENDELLRISLTKQKGVSVTAVASLQADVYELFQLTLLKFDFSYKYTDESYLALTIYEKDREAFLSNSSFGKEIQKTLLLIPPNQEVIKDNIISWQKREEENLSAQYLALIFGGYYKLDTVLREYYIRGQVQRFFVHYARSVAYIENLVSKVINILITRLLNFSLFSTAHVARWEKFTEIQYHSNAEIERVFAEGSVDEIQEQSVDDPEKFSITIRKTYYAQATRGVIGVPFKNYALAYMSRFTSLDPKITQYVQDEVLYGPLLVKINIVFMKMAFSHLNKITVGTAANAIKTICDKQIDSKQQVCRDTLVKTLGDYRDIYDKTKKLPFYKLKNFIEMLRLYAYNLSEFELFFGKDNIFYSGYFAARHSKGYFETYFNGGIFQGVGTIDNYIRKENGDTTIIIPYWEEESPTF